ncbi:MAG: carboxymuconolactone decarboxylase family protein [Parachlamydia sp.]|jgi:uncharacterized peroxidase-related enzyme|nr:carboxymuconolactone decarboxylase family protein [Parachlamydia sp.]
MARINPVPAEKATGELQDIYQNLENKMGRVLNVFSTMAHSPAVLKGFLNLSESANQTSLTPQLKEEIALVVAQTNNCRYCLSAHSQLAKGAGILQDDILQARLGQSKDQKTQSILAFSKKVVEKRANVSDQDVQELKNAGVSEQEMVEIILLIVVNLFTNYFNIITDPEVDFPAAPTI